MINNKKWIATTNMLYTTVTHTLMHSHKAIFSWTHTACTGDSTQPMGFSVFSVRKNECDLKPHGFKDGSLGIVGSELLQQQSQEAPPPKDSSDFYIFEWKRRNTVRRLVPFLVQLSCLQSCFELICHLFSSRFKLNCVQLHQFS